MGTCALADRIARVACDRYAALVAPSSSLAPTRTVLAAFVALDRATDALDVIALGVGTKTIARGVVITGRELLDAHAEVLARRGLKKFFFEAAKRRRRGDELARVEKFIDFDISTNAMAMKPGVELHFYVSSAPCGNACVRRWAKGERVTTRRDDLGTNGTPVEAHAPLARSAVDQGQVGLCVKISKARKDEMLPENVREMVARGEVAPGTAPVGFALGASLTCGDKVCVWNVVGYQGALLRKFISEPVRVRSIVVGRKFSAPHLRRAVCCRVDGFETRCGGFKATHPALMETAVVFDDVPMDADEGATFDNPFAMVWCAFDDEGEILNSKTGRMFAGEGDAATPSSTCKAAFFASYGELCGDVRAYTPEEYRRAKHDADPQYDAAKDELFNHPKMFEPRRDCRGWHENKYKKTSGYERGRVESFCARIEHRVSE